MNNLNGIAIPILKCEECSKQLLVKSTKLQYFNNNIDDNESLEIWYYKMECPDGHWWGTSHGWANLRLFIIGNQVFWEHNKKWSVGGYFDYVKRGEETK